MGALQAKALRRLVAYMRDRGSRICDQSLTREECLQAWGLPVDLPPPPADPPSVSEYFSWEIERQDTLDLRALDAAAQRGHDWLRAADLDPDEKLARLRRVSDWVVVEACTEARPTYVIGADGYGRRGLAFAWDGTRGDWLPLRHIKLPRGTLLFAEIVTERLADGTHLERCSQP